MPDVFDAARAGPNAFAHDVDQFTVMETHISWVFLTGAFAYKVKKPLNLGFVDFRTLAARHHFCVRELELNRAIAPDLYCDVVPIGGSPAAPRFGDSPAFEYAVKMRQFPQSALLDYRVRQGQFSAEDARLLGRSVADLHGRASAAAPDSRFGKISTVAGPMFDNYRALAEWRLPEPLRAQVAACCRQDVAVLRRLRSRLSQRRRDGFTRDCHGDLHLANIIRTGNKIQAFDRLEFDDTLRFIDVINEASFPFMDLMSRHRDDLAFEFINEYLLQTGDYYGLAFLPLYARYKALIRAKVTAFHAGLERTEKLRQIREHVDCAQRLTGAAQPCLLLMRGLSRSGKSWLSARLVPAMPAIRLRADVERKRLVGLSPLQSSDSGLGQQLYSAEHTRRTYQALQERARVALRAGFHVIVDATFLRSWQRRLFLDRSDALSERVVIINCEAPMSVLRQRIRDGSVDDPSEADGRVLDWQIERAEELSAEELASAVRVNTSDEVDPDALLGAVWSKINQRAK